MKYELVNPSDQVFFEAEDDKVAFMASLLVGNGQYAAKRTDNGEIAVGFYLLGISAEELERQLGCSCDAFIEKEGARLADAFTSFVYSHGRSSLNAIVDRAHEMGRRLKARMPA